METKAEKAATFLTFIINRYPPEADLQVDLMEGYSAEEKKYEWDTSVSYEEALEHLVEVSSTSPGTDKVTIDAKGRFDALLRRRLLHKMRP